ncbi:MAG TPA: AMP-binding protein, partial [Acidimicrobiales bacterium]|nr:AMP-binding protein [Acidimicrobiales bacterium]
VPRADAAHLIDAVGRWRPAGMYCIPAVWSRVLEAAGPDDRSGADLSCVLHADTGTSATPLEFLRRIRNRLPGATTSVFYGSSEAGHHTTLADWDVERKPGSVGRAAPPLVVRVDPDGEVCVRGPTLMSGYHDLPDESAAALVDGWYHTGDLGHLDDEGYLHITGRKREVIRTGGESVPPPEVEAALADYPGLVEVAVIGIPDDTWGEIVCAAVVMDRGAEAPTVTDLRAHVASRLAASKHPRRVAVVASIPRTGATGQVQRTLLRETVLLHQEGIPQ